MRLPTSRLGALPLFVLLGSLALGAVAASPPVTAAQPKVMGSVCPAPRAIPAGFDYPQFATTIEKWVKDGDVARGRKHGWALWAALNSAVADVPVWKSWCTETQAFGPPGHGHGGVGALAATHGSQPMRQLELANGIKAGPDPINFPAAPVYAIPAPVMDRYKNSKCILPPSEPFNLKSLANGPTLQNNGDVMIAGVIYNQPAYDWIRQKRLYQQAVLQSLAPAKGAQAQIPDMPAGSIVLKPMMWPVKATGFTALPMWDDQKSDDGVYAGFEIQKKWPRAVAVTADRFTVVPSNVTFLHGVAFGAKPPLKPLGPNTYVNPKVVHVQAFYNYRPNLATMDECDRAILDASAYYAYGRMFQQGDYLVLVAMHVMTKEQPAWTFQSVWWHDQPDAGPYAADRPSLPAAKGPWAHYLMASTYGVPATPGGTQWPIAYNPYIELAADHPIATNCMNCHHRAAWPHKDDEYLAAGGPGALDIFAQNNPIIFDGRLSVDSLWSISDRVPSPKTGAGR